MMPCLLLLLAGMRSATSILYKYNISGTIYSTSENDVDKVMPNIQIHLFEEDFFKDDDLGNAVTDGKGHFELVGEEDEGDEPEPYLIIPSDYCDHELKVCKRFRLCGFEVIDRNWRSQSLD
jgi:hypothetical protein